MTCTGSRPGGRPSWAGGTPPPRPYAVANLDVTVLLERPKVSPVKAEMRANIAACLGVPVDRVNLKAKTGEKVDAVGEGRAVAVHAVVLLTALP
eukprot:contig_45452_g10060